MSECGDPNKQQQPTKCDFTGAGFDHNGFHYEWKTPIDQDGQFGAVWNCTKQAIDKTTPPTQVAIKCVLKRKIPRIGKWKGISQKWNAQAQCEMRNLGVMRRRQERGVPGSEYLVKFYESFEARFSLTCGRKKEDLEFFCMVFEPFPDGTRLLHDVMQPSSSMGDYSEGVIRDFFRKVLLALASLQSQGKDDNQTILHFDISPFNIAIKDVSGELVPIVFDLGNSVDLGGGTSPVLPLKSVNPRPNSGFAPPELLPYQPNEAPLRCVERSDAKITKSSDVACVGYLLFLALSGHLAFRTSGETRFTDLTYSMRDIFRRVSAWKVLSGEVKDFLCKCVDKPDARFTVDAALNHPWMTMESINRGTSILELKRQAKRKKAPA